jgi:hypothetical protein
MLKTLTPKHQKSMLQKTVGTALNLNIFIVCLEIRGTDRIVNTIQLTKANFLKADNCPSFNNNNLLTLGN